MYQRAIGRSFAQLPAAVRRFHTLTGSCELNGWVDAEAPSTRAARFLARSLGTPLHATSGPIRFELHAGPEEETWTRHFPHHTMTSRMRLDERRVIEQLGAARLVFELCGADRALVMRLTGVRFMGIPCPRWLIPSVVAEESGDADQLHFTVRASLPLVGTVASYRGHLNVTNKEPQ